AEQLPISALPAELRDRVDAADLARGSVTTYRAVGCEQCRNIGYKGRLGIFELMEVDEPMQSLIARTSESNVLREAARKAGMKTLRQDGVEKSIAGVTTLDEVLRVTTEGA